MTNEVIGRVGNVEVTQEDIDRIANSNSASVAVLMPPGMKDALKAFCEGRGQSTMEYVRKLVADSIGYTLPEALVRDRGRKYATEAEKIAAQKAAAKTRREEQAAAVKFYRDQLAGTKAPAEAPAEA